MYSTYLWISHQASILTATASPRRTNADGKYSLSIGRESNGSNRSSGDESLLVPGGLLRNENA